MQSLYYCLSRAQLLIIAKEADLHRPASHDCQIISAKRKLFSWLEEQLNLCLAIAFHRREIVDAADRYSRDVFLI